LYKMLNDIIYYYTICRTMHSAQKVYYFKYVKGKEVAFILKL